MKKVTNQRIILRKISENNADSLFQIWNDQDLIKYTYQPYFTNIDDCKKYINRIIDYENKNCFNYNTFVIELNKNIIGLIVIQIRSKEAKEYELYYILLKKYWGQGLATEATIVFLNLIFSELKPERVYAEAVTENIASWKILEKIGMMKEGCLRKKYYRNGIYKDLYIYSILKDEW